MDEHPLAWLDLRLAEEVERTDAADEECRGLLERHRGRLPGYEPILGDAGELGIAAELLAARSEH